ncbi:ferredoxin [Tabrizicola sp. TH137]|uniref:ferredoxin n=1 Tax=Tabrizicola sp. TH137 TaxID=2067452 RepID=UPI000C7CEFC9|nr:ferredoxin [Tabrizicola sp. TH137]PLL11843.1 ferredoxin [Tabrizicola sp. TH137]
MTLAATLAAHHLAVLGGFHPTDDDAVPRGTQTLLLLGPAEPGFWAHVTAQPEWRDGQPDPIDRWSRRTIGRIACDLGAKALFPFGGPPYHPFYTWALRTGRIWDSPVRLLVSADQGLMVSFRGALALKDRIELPAPAPRPCDGCPAPCLTACPAAALTGAGYDVAACHAFLDTAEGIPCLTTGCETRRACPVSQAYARLPEQSAYHMRRFHGVD